MPAGHGSYRVKSSENRGGYAHFMGVGEWASLPTELKSELEMGDFFFVGFVFRCEVFHADIDAAILRIDGNAVG